ncbi:MAG: TlpA family protein disulfide reductase [Flavobacteriales bacterium]|nr:TlpA family protein disulfide reductase [Flavobacteriales bacterium]
MKKLYTTLLLSFTLVSLNAQTSLTTAVDFTVTDVHGNSHNLFSLLNEGKYVIVDFFFTTCGPCISSVPTLNQAFTDYGCNTGEVFFISIDDGDSDAEVLQYENSYGGLLPSVSGNDGGGNSVNSAYGISAYPTVILIAPDHTILEQDIFPVSNITTALPNAGLNISVCDTGSSTAITEITIEKEIKENRIFDVLGRQWNVSFVDLPKGVYIINNRKVLKTK